MALVHATSVALDGAGLLLLGPSGSGKSDLALRLIDRGAILIADDQVDIFLAEGRPFAQSPPAIRGLIEARGIGLLRLPYLASAPLVLAVRLGPGQKPERMPEPALWQGAGVSLPQIDLDPFEASAPAKLRLALMAGHQAIMRPQ